MQRPNSGDPFLQTVSASAPAATPGYISPQQATGFPNQFPASPFAVANPTAPGTGGHRRLPNITELFHSFKRRWVLILMVGGLLGAMFAAGVWMALPSGKHQAQALIQLRSDVTRTMGRVAPTEVEFDRFVESELATMKTKGFMTLVASIEEVSRQPLIAMADDKARAIENIMVIKRSTPEIISITMNGDDANQLKIILHHFVEKYKSETLDAMSKERTSNIEMLDKAIKELNNKIKIAQEKMNEIAREKGAGVDGNSGLDKLFYTQQLTQIIQEQKKFTDERNELEFHLAQLRAEEASGDYYVDPELLAKDLVTHPGVISRQAEVDAIAKVLANLKEKLVGESQRLTEEEEKYRKAVAAVDKERAAVRDALVKNLKVARKQNLTVELKATETKLKLVMSKIESSNKAKDLLEDRVKKLSTGNTEQSHEKGELEPLMEQRNALTKQRNEMEYGEGKQGRPRVEIKEDAQVYLNYNLKQKMALAAFAGFVGLMAVMLLISYLEWRNRRVDGVDQVVSELGMRVIGTIPAFPSRASLRSGDAGQNQNWRFILNESVNSTRTMLLHTAKTQQMQVIMVTSAMQGEGKTSLSSQLATSMATAGLRTLILDFDLRNPSMQKLFDVQVAPGCCEILLQEVDVSDCVQPTTVPNLWIIPAGQCNHRVIAALAQGHPLESLFNRLRGQFDIIVVDSCPILPVADSLLVAQHVDGVVFSILQDVSQLPKVMDASERLVQLNIPLLGAVVNGIKPDIQAYGYNYVKQLPA